MSKFSLLCKKPLNWTKIWTKMKPILWCKTKLTLAVTAATIILSSFTNSLESNIQNIVFSNISQNEGLSQGIVVSCCQDSLGHMWFATHDGLNRYDGYRFTIYRNEPDDSTSIVDNMICKVYTDSKGALWVGTEKGLSYYDRAKDRFRNYRTGNKPVTGIVDMEDGKYLIAAGGSLKVFDSASEEWIESTPVHQKESFGATIIYKHGNDIYVGTRLDGLFRFTPATNELTKISAFRSRRSIQCMSMDSENRLWVATEGDGLTKIDLSDGSSTVFKHIPSDKYSLSSNFVRTISPDSEGRMWIGTFNGLSIYENGRFINIHSDPFIQGSLAQSSVRCITRDTQGGMWLGTWLGGIDYWHPLKNRFVNIRRERGVNSLNDNIISCITEDSDGSLWIGTKSGGVNHYDSKTGKFRYYSLERDIQNNLLESNDIKAIHIDSGTGRIYVGAHAGGLNIINKNTGSISHSRRNNTDDTPLDVYAIIPASESTLWIGTLGGLLEYEKATGRFIQATYSSNGKILEGPARITTLLEDSQKRLWIGTKNGPLCYTRNRNGHLTPVLPQVISEQLAGKYVQCLFESSTKLIWISTRSGMYCYDEREQEVSHYTVEDGLPGNIIHGMEEDAYGRLWISTDNGLCCFNPFSGTLRNFSVRDGIQSNQFNIYSHCMRSNGEMLFGGINGITTFFPENLKDNPHVPAPQIIDLHVASVRISPDDGTGILDKAISLTESIELDHDQNSITLDITVPNYLSGQRNTFSYILEGYDNGWKTTEDPCISYSNLPHGKYTLKVKAANNDGKWNENAAVLKIRIRPVWYRTILAECFFLLAVLLLVWCAYRIIIERKERESKEELDKQEKAHQEDIHQMKMRFFINISHEMRTPLMLILNPLQEMISKNSDTWMRKQLKYVERNAKRLMHLINQLMDYRRAELGVFKLRIRPEDAHKIIKENWGFYERLAQNKKIQYSLLSELEGKTLLIDGQYLELILNNLLSNAFKYTDSGSITVKATQNNDELCIEISDTGKGIPEDEQGRIFERFYQVDSEHIGSGIGLSLVQKLISLHHGRISLNSTPGEGSTFTVCLPLSLSAYSPEELGNEDDTHNLNSLDHYVIETDSQENIEYDNLQNKRGKVLIAEDNEEIRTYLSTSLSGIFDITLAKNGEEALALLKENAPDIVITDMMMPVMDGLKLCAAIKQNINTSHIPVIMLSAKTDSKDQMDALKTGADDYITKPFSLSVLIAKIQNILRTYHRVQDKATKSMEIAPEKISFNALDEQLLKKAISVIERNLDNSNFSTEEFAEEMNMSRSNLHLKLKALTGESALDFIRKIRFKEACRLLKDGRYSISEISDMVGFNTPSYFATCFKKYMGCLPTEYVKNLK